jgi:hypothetical protein
MRPNPINVGEARIEVLTLWYMTKGDFTINKGSNFHAQEACLIREAQNTSHVYSHFLSDF